MSTERTRMRRPAALLLAALLAAGCQNCEPVESELRARENELAQLHGRVTRLEADNVALQRELIAVRHNTAAKITPELAAQTYTVQRITLGRQTGGYHHDGQPGDEALQVVMLPLDPDGQAIKAPGSVDVRAVQVNAQGLKEPLGAWHVPPEQLRRAWRSGLFSTGYFLIFPWQTPPTSDHLRVTVRFTLADGRVFEADKDVTIHLPPGAPPGPLPAVPPPDGPAPDGPEGPPLEETPLPAPRKADPPATTTAPAALWQETPAPSLATAVQMLRPVPAGHGN